MVLRPEALRADADACFGLRSADRAQRSRDCLAASIGPQDNIFGEQTHQGSHLPGLRRLTVRVEQTQMGLRRGGEAWTLSAQMEPGPAEGAAARRLGLAEH